MKTIKAIINNVEVAMLIIIIALLLLRADPDIVVNDSLIYICKGVTKRG